MTNGQPVVPVNTRALGLIVALAACFGAAALGSLATAQGVGGWYATLERPGWTPPNWVFGPVWTILYLMMAVATWRVWLTGPWRHTGQALGLFAAQLALNVLWSVLFFGLHMPGAALVEIVVLWAAILATTVVFFRHSRLAGTLMVPYLAWVSYAITLNFGFWYLN